tara:strand:- start:4165 stop:4482 length:318 start_codon:yes stop_codon:yes gene_type:complete
MQYKTIVMEMLQDRTELHEQLRRERKLLTTIEAYAMELKASHEAFQEQLHKAHPGSDPMQTSSEAFEMAIKELEDRLPTKSEVDEPAELSLDGAMAFIRSHSRRG